MKPGQIVIVAIIGALLGAGAGVGWQQYKATQPLLMADPVAPDTASVLPVFSYPDLTGDLLKSTEWGDKIIVLNFWASWCPPCREETPMFVALQEQYRDKGVQFVGIAIDDQEPVHVVQFDAHLDFVDERHGVRFGHGNPMRRAAEKDYVTGLSQIGIRNVSSTAKDGYDAARAMGSDIISVRQFRKLGVEAVLDRIPAGKRYYITIDIDGFDPSIAPGTGTPSHGGFNYYEGLELMDGLARRGSVVGIDLVEVAPDYDHAGSTSTLAAQLLLNIIGRVLYHSN